MGILALYDTSGIQRFIYDSNRLKDNRGGSILVDECFKKYLIRSVNEIIKNAICNWEKGETVQFLDNQEVECEVIYIGGGNAQLYFKDSRLYKEVNTRFSRYLLEEMPGITVVSDFVEIENCDEHGKDGKDGKYGGDIDDLFKKLQVKKQKSRGVMNAPCLSVTRECYYMRQAAVELDKDDGRWISEEIIKKREKSKQETKTEIYKEIEELAGVEGEQWVATVHIDGNKMGDHVNAITKNCSYKDGIKKMRKFSRGIQETYDKAYEEMCGQCKEYIEKSKDSRLDAYKKQPPFRKIYGAGDDLTFICYAPIAIKAAEIFMKCVAKNPVEGRQLSSCAGIAFSKPGYPFFKAYIMAEQCCKSAKEKARSDSRGSKENIGNYVDFQVIRGSQDSLSLIRKKNFDKGDYKLLLRPYAVTADSIDSEDLIDSTGKNFDEYNLKFFYKVSDFLYDKKISRSKMKELRNAYYVGKTQAMDAIALIKRRYGSQMSDLEKMIENSVREKQAPYINNGDRAVLWDALEMMDIYIKL